MEIIASTGGKGGTGKSTFAVLLALKLCRDKKVVLVDADVECPNDYLLLGKKLENGEEVYREVPKLDESKCKKCGKCVEVCRRHAIFMVKEKFPFFVKDLCSGCGACWLACPSKAILREKESIGKVFTTQVKENLWLVTGMSNVNVSETVEIVKQAREKGIKIAKERNADFVILDTGVGTHCNVIQALIKAEKIYAVTEPTPLGAHDLRLILKLVKKLGKKVEIVLNRSDLGDRKKIEEVAKEFSVKISKEIPYSEELLKAYCEGKLERMVKLIE